MHINRVRIAVFWLLAGILSAGLPLAAAHTDRPADRPARLQAARGEAMISGKVVTTGGSPLPGLYLAASCRSGDCQITRLHLPLIHGSTAAQPAAAASPRTVQARAWQGVSGSVYITSTNSSGVYTFTNLPAGEYVVALVGKALTLTVSLPPAAVNRDFICPNCDRSLEDSPIFIFDGPFQMGCAQADIYCLDNEKPLHSVMLSLYAIDSHEVTNARYAECVQAGACTPPHRNDSSTHTFYYGNPDYDSYPVINVDWYQANAFCAWEGKRLPTEAEWEKAVRGGSETRTYPWGDRTPECSLGNFRSGISNSGAYCVGDTSRVGHYFTGISPYWVYDLAGNVWEWVNDWYSATYYASSPYANPRGPETGEYRLLRGGSWLHGWLFVRASFRYDTGADAYTPDAGFRCVQPF